MLTQVILNGLARALVTGNIESLGLAADIIHHLTGLDLRFEVEEVMIAEHHWERVPVLVLSETMNHTTVDFIGPAAVNRLREVLG